MFDTALPSETSTEQATAGLAEVTMLESWLDHELRCESTHRWENADCGVEVTHLFADCAGRVRVCVRAAGWVRQWMQEGVSCEKCARPASKCWKVVPI